MLAHSRMGPFLRSIRSYSVQQAVKVKRGKVQSTSSLSDTITRVDSYGPEGHKSRKGFRGPLRGAVLDWSGTTADAHVIAPAACFVDAFKSVGIEISMREARGPMGKRKDVHIQEILELPEVGDRWEKRFGRRPNLNRDDPANDIDYLYKDFVPMQVESLPKYTDLLPGTAETMKDLQSQYGMKIGVTTGFTSEMVDVLLDAAREQDFVPDSSVAGDQVANGGRGDKMVSDGSRPAPFMLYQNLINMGVHPIESVIKVDDTVTGVQEGLNAGCWTVGMYGLSNYTDVDSLEQWEEMSDAERHDRRLKSRQKLLDDSGAHYVIESIRDMPAVCDDINRRLANGEMP